MEKFETFLSQYPTRSYKKGEIILHQGDEPHNLYVVKEGFVKNYEITAEGIEKPILFDVKFESFPIGWLFELIDEAQFFYEAFTDVELYVVPREDMNQFLKHNPDSQYEYFRIIVRRMLDLQVRFVSLQQNKASDKVLTTLYFLVSRFGHQLQDSEYMVDLPLTQQDMANYLGLTRETTSTQLNKLHKYGAIHYEHQRYTINMKKLNELMNEK